MHKSKRKRMHAQGFFWCEEEMVSISYVLKIKAILASCAQRRVGGLDIGHVQRIKRVMQHSRSPMHFQCANCKNIHTIKSVAVMAMMFAQGRALGWTSRWSALLKIGCSRRGGQEHWRQWGRRCNPSAHARCHSFVTNDNYDCRWLGCISFR